MYTKPEFAPLSRDEVFQLIDRVTFATIVTHGTPPQGLVASHLPFLVDHSRGPHGTLVSHLALANEQSALIAAGSECLVIFNGPHGYISSSWYPANPVRDSAPTWNFAIVHCHGVTLPLEQGETARHLHDLVEHLERGRPGEWRLRELGAGGMERRLPHILGFTMAIDRLEAKFKMGQDERLADTNAAMARLADGDGGERGEGRDGGDRDLAELMVRHNAHRQKGSSDAP